MRLWLTSALVIPYCCSCSSKIVEPIVPVVEPAPNIVVEESGKELCDDACDRMNAMGCIEGTPIVAPLSWTGPVVACGGATCVACEDFCEYQYDNGVFWNTSCIVYEISDCSGIESVCNPQ